MRIFNGFLIIVAATILFMLPLTEAVYSFRTDEREDNFNVVTATGVTGANVTLVKSIYDDDTSTLSYSSNITEIPVLLSWNGTTRQLEVGGLTANETRALAIGYDVDALSDSTAMSNLISKLDMVWLLSIIAFGPAALLAMFLGRA